MTAGQALARLNLPEGGMIVVQAPVAGLVGSSTAVIGAIASGKGEALFSIIPRSEFDLVGLVPVRDLSKLAVNQTAKVKIVGAGEVEGRVRRVATTVEPNTQLGQVLVALTSTRRLLGDSSRPRDDQDRSKLRRLGAADRDPLWQCRHRRSGNSARPG